VDTSAQVIRELVDEELYGEVVDYRTVPDEIPDIAAAIIEMTDYYHADLVLTTGGIGMAPRDVTPEATLKVVERLAPGLAEAIRGEAMRKTPEAALNRGLAGIRGRSLIINLPATPEGVHICLSAVLPLLPMALKAVTGNNEVKQP